MTASWQIQKICGWVKVRSKAAEVKVRKKRKSEKGTRMCHRLGLTV